MKIYNGPLNVDKMTPSEQRAYQSWKNNLAVMINTGAITKRGYSFMYAEVK